MRTWFMVAGNEPEKLRGTFLDFYSRQSLPRGIALWRWKRSYWICSPEKFRQDLLNAFVQFGIVEFSSSPPASDIEFISGDATSLTSSPI